MVALDTSLLAAALRVGSSVSLPDLFAIVTPYVGLSGCSDASGEAMSTEKPEVSAEARSSAEPDGRASSSVS